MLRHQVLAEEQKTDDETKTFCSAEISKSDAKQADTEEAIAQSTAAIEEMTEARITSIILILILVAFHSATL